MNRMNRVLAVNAEDMNAVVQPGLTRIALNEELRATGLFFSVDPGADASMGGMAATRASGTTAVRYGTMRDNILAMEAVMADGTVIRTGTKARKSSTGYDLNHLLIGSEGTLGIITELTVKLHGIPEAVSAATCRFDSVEDAVNCVILTIQSGLPMARIELLDEMMVRGFNRYADAGLPEKPHLFLEFHGSPASVTEQMETFAAIAEDFGAEAMKTATTTGGSQRALGDAGTRRITPPPRWGPASTSGPRMFAFRSRNWQRQWCRPSATPVAMDLTCTIVGHVGDGNFHAGLSVDPGNADEMARAKLFTGKLAETALRLGGTVSGEHGTRHRQAGLHGRRTRPRAGLHARDQAGVRPQEHPESRQDAAGQPLRRRHAADIQSPIPTPF